MELNQIPQNPNNWGNVADILNENSGKIEAETAKLSNATTKFKGYFSTSTALSAKWPSPLVGDTAWVGATYPGVVYRCNVAGAWLATTDVPPSNTVNLSEYATQDAVSKEFASVRSDLNEIETIVEQVKDGMAITNGSIKGLPVSIYHNILAGETLKIKITNLTNISNYLPYMFTKKDGIATGDATGGFSFEGTFYLNITSDIDEIRLVSNEAYYDYEISTLSVNERFNKLTSPKLISEGTITSSSTINIQNIIKGSVVKLSISNIISSSEYAPNAYLYLNGETGSSAIFGEYRNSVELYTITEKDADILRLVCYNEPYSYKLELLQDDPDVINIQHYNASSFIVSSLQNKYCQNPSNIINKTNGDMLVVYAASKSIYCENDGYNSKYLALSKYNVADITNIKTIELTKTIGEEMLEGDSHRVYQNPNIIGLNDSFVVITEYVNGNSYYIGYIKEEYNNINEYYNKSTQIKGVCTINGIDMTSTNIQNISATYIAEPPSVNYILPHCQIYEHNSVFYTALCYVGESSNVVLVIKSLDGVNWESITAYKTQGDETACCVKNNSLYIIQRGYDKVVSVSLSTGLVTDYSNIPIYEERPYMFICNSEIYACVGYTDNKLRLNRIGYNIYHIKSNNCKKVMSISDSNGMNYASFIMNVNDLLINYTSCVRFKGKQSDYKIINDVEEYKDTSIPPYTSMTSEVIFDRVPFIQ